MQQTDNLQEFFLRRLQRLVWLRNKQPYIEHTTDELIRGLDRCIYSTYRDCIDQGVGESAHKVLAEVKR